MLGAAAWRLFRISPNFKSAACDPLGLAARYISGYLLTSPPPGQPRLIGADASHAWLSAYAPEIGWIDFDPTNNQIPTTKHISLAWGRDYSDVTPIKGVYIGGGQNAMNVSVDVAPVRIEGSELTRPGVELQ